MASVNITGTVKVVGQTQQVSPKFSKRELVVTEAGGQFPQHIPVEFTQDKTSLLDVVAVGDEVTVTCYVNGREWTGRDNVTKYFLSLKGDRLEKKGSSAAPSSTGGYAAPPPPSLADLPPAEGEDDLPF